MRVSHFAKLEVLVPPSDYNPLPAGTITGSQDSFGNITPDPRAQLRTQPLLKTVGMAQTIRIEDTFSPRAENTIGTPLPVLVPGYMQSTLTIEKATIDGADFRNLGAFNPLWAHVGLTYSNKINGKYFAPYGEAANDGGYPFLFIVRVRNRIAPGSTPESPPSSNDRFNSTTTYSNITDSNEAALDRSDAARLNTFGTYVCVLQNATVSAQSSQAVIMDNVTALAKPVDGTWLNSIIKEKFNDQGNNGMNQVIYNLIYGYES